MKPIRVLIIDDSALVRKMLREILTSDSGIQVCAEAPDPFVARDLIKKFLPDVLTLDVEMPRMDGLTFLSNLMRLRPTPVVMVSSLTEKGADITLDALALGAVDFVAKPKLDVKHGLDAAAEEIIAKVKMAARARVTERQPPKALRTKPEDRTTMNYKTTDRLIAIGASTGGTEAIREVLLDFPADAPATVIVQHIPPGYSKAFADRLNRDCSITVVQATDNQRIVQGHAYVAPGGKHLRVERSGAYWVCRVGEDEPVNKHRPSVDVLFRSVVKSAGINATGILLTGMGEDGAQGLLEMRKSGATTICQDEASSVVWGMPGTAVKIGAAAKVVPLSEVATVALHGRPVTA
jgi:two-component system, chemotaxis family, protein-glutamate methylesterase/glutaminase